MEGILEPGTVVVVSSELMKNDKKSRLGWAKPMLKLCDRPVTIKLHVGCGYGINDYLLEEDPDGWTWAQSWMTPYTAKITHKEDCAYWIWSDRWMTVPTDKVTKTDINQLLCSKESDLIAT